MKQKLTRREQQVMDVIYRDGACGAAEVQSTLGISYSAARAVLARMTEKGLLRQTYQGPRYVYAPAEELGSVKVSALQELVQTVFKGSAVDAMGALLALSGERIDDAELAALERKIRQARRRTESPR